MQTETFLVSSVTLVKFESPRLRNKYEMKTVVLHFQIVSNAIETQVHYLIDKEVKRNGNDALLDMCCSTVYTVCWCTNRADRTRR